MTTPMQIIQELYSQAAKSVYDGFAKQQEHQQKRALQQQAVQQLQAQQLQQQLQQLQPLTEEKVEEKLRETYEALKNSPLRETYEALKNSPPKNSPPTLPPNITYGQSIPINPIVFSTSTGDVGLAPEGSPQSSAIEVARKTMKELEG